jgi:NADH-quinone oxidoreductase subunit N
LSGINVLVLLAPEVALTAGGVAILILGLLWRGEKAYRRLTAIGIVAALAALVLSVVGDTGGALPLGILALDSYTQFFRVLGTACAALALLLAWSWPGLGNEFPGLLLFAALGILLTAGGANLISIYVGIELLSITSYVLTGLLREDSRANEAALKYFLYGAVASAFMLYGFTFFFGISGAVDLAGVAKGLSQAAASVRWLAVPALVLSAVGFGFKVAAVPFHQWSPDVYEGAPTPVTAFLSVGPKLAGFAVLARVVLVAWTSLAADWVLLAAVLAVLTMTVGNLIALNQTHMKRLLAYSSIAQAGYMLIGLVALRSHNADPLGDGVVALLVYLAAYLFTNLGAFTVVMIMEDATGSDAISHYTGLIRRSPLLATALLFFFLSLVGIPPLACFLGKLFIFGAALRAELYWLAAIGVLNSVISLAYYFRVVRLMFFDRGEGEAERVPVMGNLGIALAVTWAGTAGLVFAGTPVIAWAQRSVEMLLH